MSYRSPILGASCALLLLLLLSRPTTARIAGAHRDDNADGGGGGGGGTSASTTRVGMLLLNERRDDEHAAMEREVELALEAAESAVSDAQVLLAEVEEEVVGEEEELDLLRTVGGSDESAAATDDGGGGPKAQDIRNNSTAQEPDNFVLSPRIVNGNKATRGRYGYMVSLTTANKHMCGGTLIARDIVLTAAHCTLDPKGRLIGESIEIGRYNRKQQQEGTFETHVMETQVIHPQYGRMPDGRLINDYKVIKIYGSSEYPTVRINVDSDVPRRHRDNVTLMGWGATEDESVSTVLREAEVQYISPPICVQALAEHGIEWYIDRGALCTWGGKVDSCSGDSGGPVILKGSDHRTDLQVGITSWGIGCANYNYPAVNMRVSRKIEWIRSVVCSLSSFKPPYLNCPSSASSAASMRSYRAAADAAVDSNDSRKTQLITVEIRLGNNPHTTGWLLESKKDGKLHRSVPIGAYHTARPNQLVMSTIRVVDDEEFKFVMLDSNGNGGVEYRVYSGEGAGRRVLLDGDSRPFGRSREHTFVLGRSPITVIVPWVVGIQFKTLRAKIGDEIIFNFLSPAENLVEFDSRLAYDRCFTPWSKLVPKESEGRAVVLAEREGARFFGCTRHCTTGHKVEVRVTKKGNDEKVFARYKKLPCDSNQKRNARLKRVSSVATCERRCRESRECNGYQYQKKKRECMLYIARPQPAPARAMVIASPELTKKFGRYFCGVVV